MPRTEHEIGREFCREVADHEVLLSFLSDDGAYLFHQWWAEEGAARLEEWSVGREVW